MPGTGSGRYYVLSVGFGAGHMLRDGIARRLPACVTERFSHGRIKEFHSRHGFSPFLPVILRFSQHPRMPSRLT